MPTSIQTIPHGGKTPGKCVAEQLQQIVNGNNFKSLAKCLCYATPCPVFDAPAKTAKNITRKLLACADVDEACAAVIREAADQIQDADAPEFLEGLAEDIDCSGNDVGISIGHRDTDNVVRGNRIAGSRTVGLLFRPERGATFCGHRNRIDGNTFADNGGDAAAVIDVQGGTEEVALVGNTITESRGAAMRVGIRLGADTKNIRLDGNSITGVATPVERLS